MKSFLDHGIIVPTAASGEINLVCPQCSPMRKKSKDKCLSLNVDKAVWNCNHCGWCGGLNDNKSDFVEHKKTYTLPTYSNKTDLPEPVLKYFAERGIDDLDVLIRNKIGYGMKFMPQDAKEMNTIQFPYLRGGEVVNIKYRTKSKHFCMVSKAERILYGMDDINPEMTIIVEGEMDKLAFEMAGYENVVSVPDGAPSVNSASYSSKFDFLGDEVLDKVKRFVLAVDGDAAGKRLEDEMSRRLGVERCARVVWPEDCKDANESLVMYGKPMLVELINGALDFPVAGIFEVADVVDKLDRLYNEGFERGLSTGWKAVDKHYTVRTGEWTLITGMPGHGKSNFLDALMVNLAREHQWRFCICSPENQPVERHMAGLIEKKSGKSIQIKHQHRISEDSYKDSKKWLNHYFSFVMPEAPTVKEVLRLMRVQVKRRGVQGIVIDPWNEIEHSKPAGVSETEYISKALSEFRNFARNNKVHLWIVAHPSKMYKDKDGNYPIPTPYDVSGSAHWRNKADNALTVWRDFNEDSQIVELHVQKVRFKEVGSTGMAELAYNGVTGMYSDLDKAHKEIPTVFKDNQIQPRGTQF